MTEQFVKHLTAGVSNIQVVAGIPYGIKMVDSRPYIFNFASNQKIASTSNSYQFGVSTVSIYFFKFPNRILASINPVSSQLTMLRARPGDYKNDFIFVSGAKPFILLNDSDSIVLANGNEATYFRPNDRAPKTVNLRGAVTFYNIVLCSEAVISYDSQTQTFSLLPLPDDQEIVSAIQRLRSASKIENEFYYDGIPLLNEMSVIMRYFGIAGADKYEASAFEEPFSTIIDEQITYTEFSLSSNSVDGLKTVKEENRVTAVSVNWTEINDVITYRGNVELESYQRSALSNLWQFERNDPIIYTCAEAPSLVYVELRPQTHISTKDEAIRRFRELNIHSLVAEFERDYESTEEGAKELYALICERMEMK